MRLPSPKLLVRRLAESAVLAGQFVLSASFLTWAQASCGGGRDNLHCDNGHYAVGIIAACVLVIPFLAGLAMPSKVLAWGVPIAGFLGINVHTAFVFVRDFLDRIHDLATAATVVLYVGFQLFMLCGILAAIAVWAYVCGSWLRHRTPALRAIQ